MPRILFWELAESDMYRQLYQDFTIWTVLIEVEPHLHHFGLTLMEGSRELLAAVPMATPPSPPPWCGG